MSTPKASNRLKELRKQKGMTQKQLAAACGVKERIISKIEQDHTKRVCAINVTRLIRFFNVRYTDIFN